VLHGADALGRRLPCVRAGRGPRRPWRFPARSEPPRLEWFLAGPPPPTAVARPRRRSPLVHRARVVLILCTGLGTSSVSRRTPISLWAGAPRLSCDLRARVALLWVARRRRSGPRARIAAMLLGATVLAGTELELVDGPEELVDSELDVARRSSGPRTSEPRRARVTVSIQLCPNLAPFGVAVHFYRKSMPVPKPGTGIWLSVGALAGPPRFGPS